MLQKKRKPEEIFVKLPTSSTSYPTCWSREVFRITSGPTIAHGSWRALREIKVPRAARMRNLRQSA